MIASLIGLLTLILTIAIGIKERRQWVRTLSMAALGAVVAQGILGGLTVLLKLPAPISIAHACLAQTFFVIVVTLASIYGKWWASDRAAAPSIEMQNVRRWAGWAFVTLYLQLVLGAALRHIGWSEHLLTAHIFNAVLVAFLVLRTSSMVSHLPSETSRLRQPALFMAGLVLAQIVLGISAYVSRRAVPIATAHVAMGALLLATTAALFLRAAGSDLKPLIVQAAGRFNSYLELTKPRLTLMAVITAAAGFYIGSYHPLSKRLLLLTALGSAIVGAGAGALNQYFERKQDAQMTRTQKRPLPQGRVRPIEALLLGTVLSIAGITLLGWGTNRLTAVLAATTLISYIGIYTPLKTRTVLCTLVGAIPGALPPLMGWAAARGTLDPEAWVLFSVLFLWQLPHFLALAWIYREDYARAGFKMLPVIDPQGSMLGRQIALYCLALIPVSLIPVYSKMAGGTYFVIALGLGLGFLGMGLATALAQTPASARRLFHASLIYLPSLITAMALDKTVF